MNLSKGPWQPPNIKQDSNLDSKILFFDYEQKTPHCGIFIPWKDRNGKPAKFTMLYSYDLLGEDMDTIYENLFTLSQTLNINILLFDYYGYGRRKFYLKFEKQQFQGEETFFDDIIVAYRWLTDSRGISPNNIILCGKGLGTGPVLYMASLLEQSKDIKNLNNIRFISYSPFEKFAGVVLLNPISSGNETFPFLEEKERNFFKNCKKIGYLQCPILIMHGANNNLIKPAQAKKLLGSISNKKKQLTFCLLENTGHFLDFSENFLAEKFIEFVHSLYTPEQRLEIEKNFFKKEVPICISSSPSEILGNWLKPFKLEHYKESFLQNGYFSLEDIKEITQDDFMKIEIKQKDRGSVWTAIQTLFLQHPKVGDYSRNSSSSENFFHPDSKSENFFQDDDNMEIETNYNQKEKKKEKPKKKHKKKQLRTKAKLTIVYGTSLEQDENEHEYVPPAPKFCANRCSVEQYDTDCNITKRELEKLNHFLQHKNLEFVSPPKQKKSKIFSKKKVVQNATPQQILSRSNSLTLLRSNSLTKENFRNSNF